jgi:GT2 family glycosyltransferase
MTVTAVIPHWNRRELLETLLASMRAQTRPFDRVIVVDNGSTDGSAELAESRGAEVIRLAANAGFAAAVNRGVDAAAGDWVAILNNDVTLEPGWLKTLLDRAGEAWFATGKILSAADGTKIDGAWDEISRGACPARVGWGKPDSAYWNQERTIRFAPMTAALFRCQLFKEVGPLDETFGSYLEDVDFGIRCARTGRSGAYIPAAVAHHVGSATQGAWKSDTVFLLSRNQILLTSKHFQGFPQWPIVAGQLLWGLLALRHARGFAWLRGKISGWKAARTIRANVPGKELLTFQSVVEASERAILEAQQQTGFDWYWRVYFCALRL